MFLTTQAHEKKSTPLRNTPVALKNDTRSIETKQQESENNIVMLARKRASLTSTLLQSKDE